MRGIPGLSDIPLIGRIFANNERESQQTDVVLMLTPRIVRVLDVTEDDLRPFLVGRGSNTGAAPPEMQPIPAIPSPRQPPQGSEDGLDQVSPFTPQSPAPNPEQPIPQTPTPQRPPTPPAH